jgi:hypothetical protein
MGRFLFPIIDCPLRSLHETRRAAALERELTAIIDGDRYFLSPRIQTLREIRNMIRPEPKREPLPEPKCYEPPRGGRYRRRG